MKKILLLTIVPVVFQCSCVSRLQGPYRFRFTELETGCNESLRALQVVDEHVIWASGTNGTFLVSSDGGQSWKVGTVGSAVKNDFRGLHAWDSDRALVFGVSGPVFGYLTEDAGETWTAVYRDDRDPVFFNSLKFCSDTHGLAVSDPVEDRFLVLRTRDGGKTWQEVTDLPSSNDGEANFAASNTCIEYLPTGRAWFVTGGVTARLFYSVDFGQSWQVTDTPLVEGQSSTGIFSVAFQDDRSGVIVGGDYQVPELNQDIAAFSTDGGVTWQPSETMPRGFRSCVQYVSMPQGGLYVAVGKTGCDYSLDNGRHWTHITDQGYYTCRPVPGKTTLFAAGSNGRIARIEMQ